MRYKIALMLIFIILAMGCGQKGPLYLPDQEDTVNGSLQLSQ